jgi:hypothetical protein
MMMDGWHDGSSSRSVCGHTKTEVAPRKGSALLYCLCSSNACSSSNAMFI